MEATIIQEIKPELTKFLKMFDSCFGRVTTRRYLDMYVGGQLGPLPRKSVEPIADAAGVSPRNLQQFLGAFRWDQDAMRDQLQRYVGANHADANSIGLIDETTFPKKGDKTAGVQHQYCGAAGKQANCVMSVHLGYVTPDGFHCMLDGELYLPEGSWHEDRDRCREAGVPDTYSYRPKWKMALDQLVRANQNGVRVGWVTFDEAYGRVGEFRRTLEKCGQNFVGEVPTNFAVWTQKPPELYREHARERLAKQRARRLKVKSNPRVEVRNVLRHSPVLRQEKWVPFHVKDGTKGPMVWEAKRIMVWPADAVGMPGAAYHLLVARNVLSPKETKFFISNAPASTSIQTLLLVAFSRWNIERLFENTKEELGLDHFEARRYTSIQRHLILTNVSHLFLAELQQKHGGEKKRPDFSSIASGDGGTGAAMGGGQAMHQDAGEENQR